MGDCVVGSCLFVFGYLALRRDLGKVVTVLRDRKMLLWLSASAVLISANWLLYVWAVTANHIVETSLGYFINPLVSVLFGVFILRERLNRLQWTSIAIAALGVLWLTLQAGRPPWIALALALTFGSYGLIRKMVIVESVVGLGVETLLIAPVILGYLLWIAHTGTMNFLAHDCLIEDRRRVV